MNEQYTPTEAEVRAGWMTSGPPASTIVRALEFERFLDQVRREAKIEALREARNQVFASSFWADGSDNYADRVRGWLSHRADQLEQEGKNDE